MQDIAIRAIALTIALVIIAFATGATAITLIRWAKRGSRGAAILGSTFVLLFGGGLAPPRPQTRIEEAKEDKDKQGAESGDPPDR